MFKFLGALSLLLVIACKVSALTEQEIEAEIRSLQSSLPGTLAQNVLGTPSAYQNTAMLIAKRVLKDNSNVLLSQVRDYYALACVFQATSGKSNPRTDAIIPGQVLPGWTKTNQWNENPDYCEWYGVRCFDSLASDSVKATQMAQKKVLEISLARNNLYGTFPNEIALLGDQLLALDLFENPFLYCIDYRWFSSMNAIEALYFRSTSFEADDIPASLGTMTTLYELDFSNTFWNGILTKEAFSSLTLLTFIDIGGNSYDFSNLQTIPDYIASLPSLRRFHAGNIRPTQDSQGPVITLEFLTRMPNIVEVWMDYTKIRGPLPSNIGNAKSLRSFSCAYCQLTGGFPASIVDTNLARLWLFGNPDFTGGFPFGFQLFKWRYLYLEGTGITEQIPAAICNQVDTDVMSSGLLELGADCNLCPVDCCTCCGDECNNLFPPTPPPTKAPTSAPVTFLCFSGDSTVEVLHRGPQKMTDLSLGDKVKVGTDGKFEPIYSFGHKNALVTGKFLAISTEGNRAALELSEDHMVAVQGDRFIPASMLQRGDKLLTGSGEFVTVKSIRKDVMRKGVFAPFTLSGTIVVNDILASSYVAFQGSEFLKVSSFSAETAVSYQWFAHTFNSPHRIAYNLGLAATESYTVDGMSCWVHMPHSLGLWLLQQNAFVMIMALIPMLAVLCSISFFEFTLFGNPASLSALIVVGAISFVLGRPRVIPTNLSRKSP